MFKNTQQQTVNQLRRNLLKWAPPTIASVALPVHAQISLCGSAPTMVATVPSKCAGDPPVGQAVITLFSDASDPAEIQLEIRSVTINGADASDTFTIPSLPADVIDTVGLEIQWSGNATDATTCLPLSVITIDVVYACTSAGQNQSISFNFTEVLAAAL